MFKRYAIFYTPPAGPFADLMAAWLGWNSASGQTIAPPVVAGLDVAKLTARPRKYGFHATMKAPFHLVRTATHQALIDALETFTHRHAPVKLGAIELNAVNGFLALRPLSEPTALRELAAEVVTKLDGFRAPLTPDDIARRRRSRLTARQDQQMLNWGYPFVFDDFQFHMTLTGQLRRNAEKTTLEQVHGLIAPALPSELQIDALTLMGQDATGMFHQICRMPLRAH